MHFVTRKIVLETLTRHETLTIDDIAKEENLGFTPDEGRLKYLLHQLTNSGFIDRLDGVLPHTFTITTKGIEESNRLQTV